MSTEMWSKMITQLELRQLPEALPAAQLFTASVPFWTSIGLSADNLTLLEKAAEELGNGQAVGQATRTLLHHIASTLSR